MDLSALKVSCRDCSLAELCLPMGLSAGEIEQLDRIIRRRRPLRRGEHLFEVGDEFHALCAVRSGTIKTHISSGDGGEQVLGFHLPGELVGLDALDDGRHSCVAVALEATTLCELPFQRLTDLCQALPGLNQQLHRLIGREIAQDHGMLLLLGKKSAEERLASFLVSLSNRFRHRGFSAREFHLSMSRHDIGNYLGLAVETVSRLFSSFRGAGLLSVQRRFVRIEDLDRLRAMANRCESSSASSH